MTYGICQRIDADSLWNLLLGVLYSDCVPGGKTLFGALNHPACPGFGFRFLNSFKKHLNQIERIMWLAKQYLTQCVR